MSESKTCTKCSETKPLEAFNRDRHAKDGRCSQCKACTAERRRAWYVANREYKAELDRAYYAANKERVNERNRSYHAANRQRAAKRGRAWREANKEYAAERRREWYRANKERVAENQRVYREVNKERVAERIRTWHETNPLWQRLNSGRKRARRAGVQVDMFGAAELLAYWRTWGVDPELCIYCGGPFEQLDHMHPFKLGGPHTLHNVVPSCQACNDSKGSKPIYEWRCAS